MTLRLIYSDQYLPLNLRIRSKKTESHYDITLKHFDELFGRSATKEDLTDENAIRFARWMLSRPMRPPTVNQRLGYLRALWNWCAKKRIVDLWPTFPNVPEPQLTPRAWTLEQLDKLLASCAKEQGTIDGIPAATWWLNLHYFLWETGERIGATLKARWADVEPSAAIVSVPAELRKGQYHSMLYVISSDLMTELVAQRRPAHKTIFPWPNSEATFYNHYDRILVRAGLPNDAKSKPHRMRRSYASHLKAKGGDPTYMFRHSSARLTQQSYLDPTIVDHTPSHTILPRLRLAQ